MEFVLYYILEYVLISNKDTKGEVTKTKPMSGQIRREYKVSSRQNQMDQLKALFFFFSPPECRTLLCTLVSDANKPLAFL